MKLKILAVLASLSLSACESSPAFVSEFNGDSVKIVTRSLISVNYRDSIAQPEAQRICQTRGKNAEYASSRIDPQTWDSESLYLCI